MRIVYFATPSVLSTTPLSTLIAARMTPVALVAPRDRVPPFLRSAPDSPGAAPVAPVMDSALTVAGSDSIFSLAHRHGIPIVDLADLSAPQSVAAVAAHNPDLIAVSCFPRRLPPALLALPALGALNVHPSLLPHHRGPAPLFWTLRSGEARTGVTVHHMDAGFDTGPIALQQAWTLPDGVDGASADATLARLGGDLLVRAVRQLADGTLPRTPQPAGFGAEPWPKAADFTLDRRWPAQRAFNFMRGTHHWQRPYPVVVDGGRVLLRRALQLGPGLAPGTVVEQRGADVWVQFADRALVAAM